MNLSIDAGYRRRLILYRCLYSVSLSQWSASSPMAYPIYKHYLIDCFLSIPCLYHCCSIFFQIELGDLHVDLIVFYEEYMISFETQFRLHLCCLL